MKLFNIFYIVILCILLAVLLVAVGTPDSTEAVKVVEPPEVDCSGLKTQIVVAYVPRYTEADVEAMAVMLAGECYPWDVADMRNAAMTVCNRVDSPMWSQDTVTAVIQQTGYYGYDAHNTPLEVHYSVARQVLDDWSARSAGIDRPWEDWLFFSAVNGKNVYRVVY